MSSVEFLGRLGILWEQNCCSCSPGSIKVSRYDFNRRTDRVWHMEFSIGVSPTPPRLSMEKPLEFKIPVHDATKTSYTHAAGLLHFT